MIIPRLYLIAKVIFIQDFTKQENKKVYGYQYQDSLKIENFSRSIFKGNILTFLLVNDINGKPLLPQMFHIIKNAY